MFRKPRVRRETRRLILHTVPAGDSVPLSRSLLVGFLPAVQTNYAQR
jgi:hypothetical protein